MALGHDSFAEAIEQKLAGRLDPEVFEACVSDLLRDAFPSLAPIPGGSDAGMDGAIADGTGAPIPLVATTEKAVIRNLGHSLESYLAQGGRQRRVVVASSQHLTAPQIRNLSRCAEERGFTILQVYTREALIDRLYHSPRWCKTLLGLAAKPDALARIPSGRRRLIEAPLVGQETALAWISDTSGDRILAGPPGSGKTYLLYHLATRGFGLFLESEDSGLVLEDLRRLEPRVVIVDDANVHLDRLRLLRDLRRRVPGAAFEIVATTWEGLDQEAVARELGTATCFCLEPLPRQDIVEILRRVGVAGPPQVVRELVDQAANRPGLAVTLAMLWLEGGCQDVLTGRALSSDLLGYLRPLLGHRAADVLAVLALGGRRGMPAQAAASYLDLSAGEVRNLLVHLSPAGVIDPRGGVIVVRPRALRFALVREYFSEDRPEHFDLERVLAETPSPEAAVETILGAIHRGAKLGNERVERLLLAHATARAWDAYAALGEASTRWVLANWRGAATEIANGALLGDPAAAIRRLLEEAEGADRSPSSTARDPLQLLSDWVEDLDVAQLDLEEAVLRRRLVVEGASAWQAEGGSAEVVARAVAVALDPKLSATRTDPGKGTTVTISEGALPQLALADVEKLWPPAFEAIARVGAPPWGPLRQLLHPWVYPHYLAPGAEIPPDETGRMRAFAGRMVQDLARRFGRDPGLARRLKSYATELRVAVDVPAAPLFDLLFPVQHLREDWKDQERRHEGALVAALPDWVNRSPGDVVDALSEALATAARAQFAHDGRTLRFCRLLLERSKVSPFDYFECCLDARPPVPGLVEAVLGHLSGAGDPRALEAGARCLDFEAYRHVGMATILRQEAPPALLRAKALEAAAQYPKLVENLCLRREVPAAMLVELLEHPVHEVALAAAEGEWGGGRGRGEGVRHSIAQPWRAAILRASLGWRGETRPDDGVRWFLGEVLAADSALAFEWLALLLRHTTSWRQRLLFGDDVTKRAGSALDTRQRVELLSRVPVEPDCDEEIVAIVGDDLVAYRALLEDASRERYHYAPLRKWSHPAWVEKATLSAHHALDAKRIAFEALMGGGWTIAGSEAAHWRQELAGLEQLCADHPELQPVVAAAHRLVQPRIERSEAEERHVELFGLGGED